MSNIRCPNCDNISMEYKSIRLKKVKEVNLNECMKEEFYPNTTSFSGDISLPIMCYMHAADILLFECRSCNYVIVKYRTKEIENCQH